MADIIKLHDLRPTAGATKPKPRVGRGEASKGKTAGLRLVCSCGWAQVVQLDDISHGLLPCHFFDGDQVAYFMNHG